MAVSPTGFRKNMIFPVFHCLHSPDKNCRLREAVSLLFKTVKKAISEKLSLNCTAMELSSDGCTSFSCLRTPFRRRNVGNRRLHLLESSGTSIACFTFCNIENCNTAWYCIESLNTLRLFIQRQYCNFQFCNDQLRCAAFLSLSASPRRWNNEVLFYVHRHGTHDQMMCLILLFLDKFPISEILYA